jgi:hypothetical protein
MIVKSFGVKANGSLGVCVALPENRGKGNCNHSEHYDLTAEDLKSGFVNKFNEKAVADRIAANGGVDPFKSLKKTNSTARKKRSEENLKNLREGADELAALIPQEDFETVRGFYRDFVRVMSEEERKEFIQGNPKEAIERYLTGDEPHAVKLREYLGDGTDYKALSDLLMDEVGAMTTSHRWSTSGRLSISRAILSTLHNDMNRENYVTSILFFKGRCCYCQKPLSRKAGGQASLPTGEHITPIAPNRVDRPVGGTRFGNMALACGKCNKSRANNDLHYWLKDADAALSMEQRIPALARIQAFRKFAGYQEYTMEESTLIRDSIAKLQLQVEDIRDENGKMQRGYGDPIRFELEAQLRRLEMLIQR